MGNHRSRSNHELASGSCFQYSACTAGVAKTQSASKSWDAKASAQWRHRPPRSRSFCGSDPEPISMRSNRESDRSDSRSSQTAQTESRAHHWYVAYPARMPITPLLLAIPLLLPSDMGRWISTENDLGGVCAVVALPDGRVATLDGDSGHVRLGSGESATTLDLSRTLHQPRGLSHCEDGRIFVADTGNHRVMFFDGEGLMLGGFGGRGSEDYRLLAPHDVAPAPLPDPAVSNQSKDLQP